ncbi:uncharacterized protein LOC131037938 [Cryptomeria japonica]|uniref:uncharacterized protein LOC131037938 n=1 Tax=Cryptomeria japonica TaxID=3369 RepID=UPI0025AD3A7D|nr:uncharacterized protein LOC131037938 [Cryptomeria japonica]
MKNEPLVSIDWIEGEKSDLADLMRSVVEYSRWWASEKTKQLKAKGVVPTYELMGVDDTLSVHPCTSVGDARNPESVGSRKRKELGGSSTKVTGKRAIGERRESSESHSILSAASIAPDQSTIGEQEMNIYVIDDEVRVLSQPVEEVVEKVFRTPDRGQIEAPTIFLDGIPANPGEADNEFDRNTEEQSTIPDWLRARIKAKVPKDAHSTEEVTATFLEKVSEPAIAKPPKPARKFSLIQRDSAGFRTVQIAVPKEGKTRDNVTADDYKITTIEMGKPTQDQEIQYFDDSCNVLKTRLAHEKEKRKKVEEENQ